MWLLSFLILINVTVDIFQFLSTFADKLWVSFQQSNNINFNITVTARGTGQATLKVSNILWSSVRILCDFMTPNAEIWQIIEVFRETNGFCFTQVRADAIKLDFKWICCTSASTTGGVAVLRGAESSRAKLSEVPFDSAAHPG